VSGLILDALRQLDEKDRGVEEEDGTESGSDEPAIRSNGKH